MDLLKETKELCALYHIKPNRSKGQNFLIKEEIYDKMVAAAELNNDDVVLEVGPGLGFLTAKLAKRAKKVIAVELDKKLAEILPARLEMQEIDNVRVVNEDVLKISNFEFLISNKTPNSKSSPLRRDPARNKYNNVAGQIPNSPACLAGRQVGRGKSQIINYKIVANLPYNITSIFLRNFLSMEHKPKTMTLMLQKEVAERIAAKPPKMSLLAVSVQFFSAPEIIQNVPANNFWPQPEVDSAIIKIVARFPKPDFGYPKSGFGKGTEKDFFRLVKIGFSARRKMLKNNLAAGYHIGQDEAKEKIKQAGFDEKIRAQELSVENWVRLFEYFD